MAIQELIGLGIIGGAGWLYWRYRGRMSLKPGAVPNTPPIPNFGGSGAWIPPGFLRPKGESQEVDKAPTATPKPVTRAPANGGSNPVTVTAPVIRNGSFSVQPLFDLIKRAEAGPKGYDSYYSGVKLAPPKRPTTMTLDEVQAWQRASIRAGSKSVAVGHFQIVSDTLSGLKRSLGLNGSELFNKSLQDRMGIKLMEEVGLRRYENGSMTQRQFGNRLARVWAGFPVLNEQRGHRRQVQRGESYYASYVGNKATISATQFEAALRQVKGA